jgi:hypothetical protein
MARKREEKQTPGRRAARRSAVPTARKASDARLDALYRQVREILEQARATVARSVNTGMVRAYWLVGRENLEE